jgi:hypothetical protein
VLCFRIPLIRNGLAKTVFTFERLARGQTLYRTESGGTSWYLIHF